MMDEEKIEEAKERLKIDIADEKMLGTDVAIVYKDDLKTALNLIEKKQEQIKELETERDLNQEEAIGLNNYIMDLENKLEKVKKAITYDRMEQLDDYVIYYMSKYLEILGENDE